MEAMKRLTLLLLFMSFLVACTPAGEPAASEPQAVPVVEVATEATAVSQANTPRTDELPAPVMAAEEAVEETAVIEIEEAEATSAPPETEPVELPENEDTGVESEEMVADSVVESTAEEGSLVISGRLDEGAFFLGDPNAPVTLIDYSDFL